MMRFTTLLLAVCVSLISAAIYPAVMPESDVNFVIGREIPGILLPVSIPLEDAQNYPHITKQLFAGIQMWQDKVPVHFKVTPWLGPGDGIMAGSIRIVIGDLAAMGFTDGNPKTKILGLFSYRDRLLFLDSSLETWEVDKQKAYDESDDPEKRLPRKAGMGNFALHTVVHELGHALGLQHVVGQWDDDGLPTYPHAEAFAIVVGSDAEARTHVMYPHISEDCTEIDDLAVDLVLENLHWPKNQRPVGK